MLVKQIIFSFLIFCFYNPAIAQITGEQFAPDSTYLRESGFYVSAMPGNSTPHYSYSNKYILGDTVINNKYYQNIYYTSQQNFDTVCLGTKQLLYYENKKLYLGTSLIYDFDLSVGDSLRITFGCYSCPAYYPVGLYYFQVTQRDSVFIGDKWRSRITIAKPGVSFTTKIVEGIGDINYGFNVNYQGVLFLQGALGYYRLDCFSEHFQNTYGSHCTPVSPVCNIIGIEQYDAPDDLVHYPQPVSDVLYIQSSRELFTAQSIVTVYDFNGRATIAPAQYINGNNYKTDVSSLEAGIYILTIKTEKGILRKKLIVQH